MNIVKLSLAWLKRASCPAEIYEGFKMDIGKPLIVRDHLGIPWNVTEKQAEQLRTAAERRLEELQS